MPKLSFLVLLLFRNSTFVTNPQLIEEVEFSYERTLELRRWRALLALATVTVAVATAGLLCQLSMCSPGVESAINKLRGVNKNDERRLSVIQQLPTLSALSDLQRPLTEEVTTRNRCTARPSGSENGKRRRCRKRAILYHRVGLPTKDSSIARGTSTLACRAGWM